MGELCDGVAAFDYVFELVVTIIFSMDTTSRIEGSIITSGDLIIAADKEVQFHKEDLKFVKNYLHDGIYTPEEFASVFIALKDYTQEHDLEFHGHLDQIGKKYLGALSQRQKGEISTEQMQAQSMAIYADLLEVSIMVQ